MHKSRKRSYGSSSGEEDDSSSSDIILKTGKWTFDEEQYANELIANFESGELDDCEEGTTLRAYLSRKLRCPPMRISKKFAGKCIGKVSLFNSEFIES